MGFRICLSSCLSSRRKGFTLVEVIASAAFLAFIVIAVVSVSHGITAQKEASENSVYMSTHNLNCMERLRQMAWQALAVGSQLNNYYEDMEFGTTDIETFVYVTTTELGRYHVYNVRIASKMRVGRQRLTQNYVLTDMGAQSVSEVTTPMTPPDEVA